MKEITVSRTETKTITHCIHSCPYYETEMNVMVCSHPLAPATGYIISHDDLIDGFPSKCPLVEGIINKTTRHVTDAT
jgi:hypothetical protein